MPSLIDAQSAMRRPTLMARTSSQSSVSKDGQGGTTKTRQHRASGSKLHGRTPSYGKNLHKLTKIISDGIEAEKVTTVKKKSDPSTSPIAPIRRNTSAVSLSKNTTNAPIKKNKSEISLPRNHSSTKLHGKKAGPVRRNDSHGKNLDKAKQHKQAIKFEVEEDEGDWTEESASPVITRQSSLSKGSRTQSRLNTPPGQPAVQQMQNEPIPHSSSIDPTKIQPDGTEMMMPGSPPDSTRDLPGLEEFARIQERLRRNDEINRQTLSGTTRDSDIPLSRRHPSPLKLNGLLTPSSQPLVRSGGSSFVRMPFTPDEGRSQSPDSQLFENIQRTQSAANLQNHGVVALMDTPKGSKIDTVSIMRQGTTKAGGATDIKHTLWRSQGNVEPIDGPPAPLLRGAPIDMLTNEERKTRLWENADKELSAVRRFNNPIVEAAKRASTKDKSKPDKSKLHVAKDNASQRSYDSGERRPTTPDPRTAALSATRSNHEGPRPPSRAGGRSVRFEVGTPKSHGSHDVEAIDQILRRMWNSIDVGGAVEG